MSLTSLRFIALSSLILLSACDGKKESRPITLYKNSVSVGNSVISFVSHNDRDGSFSMIHCEELRKLYERKYQENYMCSTYKDEEFIPRIKWN
jgi:hypothetical protein